MILILFRKISTGCMHMLQYVPDLTLRAPAHSGQFSAQKSAEAYTPGGLLQALKNTCRSNPVFDGGASSPPGYSIVLKCSVFRIIVKKHTVESPAAPNIIHITMI